VLNFIQLSIPHREEQPRNYIIAVEVFPSHYTGSRREGSIRLESDNETNEVTVELLSLKYDIVALPQGKKVEAAKV
jgi:hypothetical protein